MGQVEGPQRQGGLGRADSGRDRWAPQMLMTSGDVRKTCLATVLAYSNKQSWVQSAWTAHLAAATTAEAAG